MHRCGVCRLKKDYKHFLLTKSNINSVLNQYLLKNELFCKVYPVDGRSNFSCNPPYSLVGADKYGLLYTLSSILVDHHSLFQCGQVTRAIFINRRSAVSCRMRGVMMSTFLEVYEIWEWYLAEKRLITAAKQSNVVC